MSDTTQNVSPPHLTNTMEQFVEEEERRLSEEHKTEQPTQKPAEKDSETSSSSSSISAPKENQQVEWIPLQSNMGKDLKKIKSVSFFIPDNKSNSSADSMIPTRGVSAPNVHMVTQSAVLPKTEQPVETESPKDESPKDESPKDTPPQASPVLEKVVEQPIEKVEVPEPKVETVTPLPVVVETPKPVEIKEEVPPVVEKVEEPKVLKSVLVNRNEPKEDSDSKPSKRSKSHKKSKKSKKSKEPKTEEPKEPTDSESSSSSEPKLKKKPSFILPTKKKTKSVTKEDLAEDVDEIKRKLKQKKKKEPKEIADEIAELKTEKIAPPEKEKTTRKSFSLAISIENFIDSLKGKYFNEPPPEALPSAKPIQEHHIAIRRAFVGDPTDHPFKHGKRGAFRFFYALAFLVLIVYEIMALPDTLLPSNVFWWCVLWIVVLYMNLAYMLFLTNFWWRSTPVADQVPLESRKDTVSPPGTNRYEGSNIVTVMPIAGENIEMIKRHASALYDSYVRGLDKDILVIADDCRPAHMENGKEIPCLSHAHPTNGFEEPFLLQPKPFDVKYLKMIVTLAREKGLRMRKNMSYMDADGNGYILWKFFSPLENQKSIYYLARNKYDNVPSMLKGENLNTAIGIPEIKEALEAPRSGHSFVYIVDARHEVKPEFKAALLQYYWSWDKETKQWVFHDKLSSVQAQHWYPDMRTGHPLQPNNRFFFDGVMKGRTAKGSVPNAGTMNVFQYKSLVGCDDTRPEEPRFSTYSVTEDKASEIEYFSRGYYALFHPYVVSKGVPAESIAKELDRLLRWARGNFAVGLRKNPVWRANNLPWIFRLWAIEGTMYPINGLVTLVFYLACILYIAFGVNFLTFHTIIMLVVFIGNMIAGRIAYLLSVPTISQDDMWANMTGWLNIMPVYCWSVFTYHKGYAKNAVWLSTGSKTTSDGTILQWIIVAMQGINIAAMISCVGFMIGEGFQNMWTFFARMGLGCMLFVMQINLVKRILVQNNVLKHNFEFGPVIIFTVLITFSLALCVGWEFDEDPSK